MFTLIAVAWGVGRGAACSMGSNHSPGMLTLEALARASISTGIPLWSDYSVRMVRMLPRAPGRSRH